MASSAKKRAVEMVTNGEKSENSSDESIGDEDDSLEDSEDSDEEINEVNSEGGGVPHARPYCPPLSHVCVCIYRVAGF